MLAGWRGPRARRSTGSLDAACMHGKGGGTSAAGHSEPVTEPRDYAGIHYAALGSDLKGCQTQGLVWYVDRSFYRGLVASTHGASPY